MARPIALLCLLASLFGATASAQGMSEEYVRERTRARYERSHGVTLQWDLFATGTLIRQEQKVRAFGTPADNLSYTGDFDGMPFGVFGETELRLRFSWHDSIVFGYGFRYVRAFSDDADDFDQDTRFNGVTYPQGVDLDYGADFHDFRLLYRRDLFRLGLDDSFTVYLQAGLEWALLTAKLGSDTFTVSDGRDQVKFREMLPWYSAGLGFEWELGAGVLVSAQASGSYSAGVPTFQKRDDNQMKQSITSITASATIDWAVNDWFSLMLRGRFRHFKAKLYGGFRSDEFYWQGMGPELGIGFRF